MLRGKSELGDAPRLAIRVEPPLAWCRCRGHSAPHLAGAVACLLPVGDGGGDVHILLPCRDAVGWEAAAEGDRGARWWGAASWEAAMTGLEVVVAVTLIWGR